MRTLRLLPQEVLHPHEVLLHHEVNQLVTERKVTEEQVFAKTVMGEQVSDL
jgi:hypothetical protein